MVTKEGQRCSPTSRSMVKINFWKRKYSFTVPIALLEESYHYGMRVTFGLSLPCERSIIYDISFILSYSLL